MSTQGLSFNKSFFVAVPTFLVTEAARAACFVLSDDLVELRYIAPRCALVILITLTLLSGTYLRTLCLMQLFYARKQAAAA